MGMNLKPWCEDNTLNLDSGLRRKDAYSTVFPAKAGIQDTLPDDKWFTQPIWILAFARITVAGITRNYYGWLAFNGG